MTFFGGAILSKCSLKIFICACGLESGWWWIDDSQFHCTDLHSFLSQFGNWIFTVPWNTQFKLQGTIVGTIRAIVYTGGANPVVPHLSHLVTGYMLGLLTMFSAQLSSEPSRTRIPCLHRWWQIESSEILKIISYAHHVSLVDIDTVWITVPNEQRP